MNSIKDALHGRCVRCVSFTASKVDRGMGYCRGNAAAFKVVKGIPFGRGAPEGPVFDVRKLDGCKHWTPAW